MQLSRHAYRKTYTYKNRPSQQILGPSQGLSPSHCNAQGLGVALLRREPPGRRSLNGTITLDMLFSCSLKISGKSFKDVDLGGTVGAGIETLRRILYPASISCFSSRVSWLHYSPSVVMVRNSCSPNYLLLWGVRSLN